MANSFAFAFPEKTIVGYVNKELEGKEGKLLRECFDKAGWGVCILCSWSKGIHSFPAYFEHLSMHSCFHYSCLIENTGLHIYISSSKAFLSLLLLAHFLPPSWLTIISQGGYSSTSQHCSTTWKTLHLPRLPRGPAIHSPDVDDIYFPPPSTDSKRLNPRVSVCG